MLSLAFLISPVPPRLEDLAVIQNLSILSCHESGDMARV